MGNRIRAHPDDVATLLQAVMAGAMLQQATIDGVTPRTLRDELDTYLRTRLLLDADVD